MCSRFYGGVDQHQEEISRYGGGGDLADVLRSITTGATATPPPDYSSHDRFKLLTAPGESDCCVDLGGAGDPFRSDDTMMMINCSNSSSSLYYNNSNFNVHTNSLLHQSPPADHDLLFPTASNNSMMIMKSIDIDPTTTQQGNIISDMFIDTAADTRSIASKNNDILYSPNCLLLSRTAPQTCTVPPPLIPAAASSPAPSFALVAAAAGDDDVRRPTAVNYITAADQSVHVSSSTHNSAIKRRRSAVAKKVVCVAAPSPANSSRPSGEVVPSDLWAWRKYGQKPIKGSPYPRGYYRCSSSKGCSARKQVERSRTDPEMLVITYSSEHNHPWPTHRNALAGSTRPHTSKHNNNVAGTQIIGHGHNKCSSNNSEKDKLRDDVLTDAVQQDKVATSIKGELRDDNHHHNQCDSIFNRQLYNTSSTGGGAYEQWCSYRPEILEDCYYYQNVDEQSQEDFFAEMAGKGGGFSSFVDWASSEENQMLPSNNVPHAAEETKI